MLAHFYRVMHPRPSDTILDFGVSEDVTEESNVLERYYPHQAKLTCAGIGDGTAVRSTFPDVNYASIRPGESLPFPTHTFDIAYSNAVFEHLGSDANRLGALLELQRVARRVYLTVPNRWFPVEHHTGIPILHYVPTLFRA